MRTVINGKGQDMTRIVAGALQGSNQLTLATLYLIGEPEDPNAVWLTDWQTPLTWSWWGTFYPGIITRGPVSAKVGLEVTTLQVDWTPTAQMFVNDMRAVSPYQRALLDGLAGVTFRSWTCYMPTPGDADTYGASELFGGRIGPVKVQRGKIYLTVNSFLDVINQMVPGAVVESTNSIAGYVGASGPSGAPVPTYTVVGATTKQVTVTASGITVNEFQDGFLYMTSGVLQGQWSVVQSNTQTISGRVVFTLDRPFPWPPVAGDSLYVSTAPPNGVGTGQFPFPFVPAPESAA